MIECKLNYPIKFITTLSFILIFNSGNSAQIFFPNAVIKVKYFEMLDTNKNIISASPVGGENAITMEMIYPELAKRAEIEGTVLIEFEIDNEGTSKNIRLLKDIGGGCGEQVINAISKTKFYPGKLFNKNIESRYRIAVQFEIIPISKEEEIKLKQ